MNRSFSDESAALEACSLHFFKVYESKHEMTDNSLTNQRYQTALTVLWECMHGLTVPRLPTLTGQFDRSSAWASAADPEADKRCRSRSGHAVPIPPRTAADKQSDFECPGSADSGADTPF